VLSAFGRAFRTPDLRKKLLFTLGILVLFRIGSVVPAPGVSTRAIHDCLTGAENTPSKNVLSLINLFSGGALLQLSVFALGILPYITSSIIIQLLTVVIPRLERLRKEGSSGEQKITQYTRYLTLALAVLQSTGIVALARSNRLIPGCTQAIIRNSSVYDTAIIVITMTAGTAMIMWLGELITSRGVGNGMSLLMFTSIAARLPSQGLGILQAAGGVVFVLVLLLGLAIVVFVVFVEQAQRRIPVQYAKRMIGRRMYGGTSTYIPMKVNQAGVVPVIFASSLLQLPQLLGQVWTNKTFQDFDQRYLARGDNPLYLLAYAGLIIFFTYFYVAITFNPTEVADNMKKYGGFIPGIRPGRPTSEYLERVLSRITLPGSLFLGIICVLPLALLNLTKNQQFPFAGTSVLIMVGVGLETVKQIESQLQQRNYEGFLR
jgi:preprotein translocase subunit SecY